MSTPLHRRLCLLALLVSGGASMATSNDNERTATKAAGVWEAAGSASVAVPQLDPGDSWRALVSISFDQPTPGTLEGSATFETYDPSGNEFAYTFVVSNADSVELGGFTAVDGQSPQGLTLSAFEACSGQVECRIEFVVELRATAGTPEPTLSITAAARAYSGRPTTTPSAMVIEVEPLPENTGDTAEDAPDTAEE